MGGKDANVIRAMEKNGGLPEAPKNSHGCQHCAMMEMIDIHKSDIQYYCKQGEYFEGLVCSNEGCQNGVISVDWPKMKIGSQVTYGKYCKYVTRGDETDNNKGGRACTFLCCSDCLQKRIEKEEQQMGNGRKRSRRSSTRLKQ